MGIIPVRAQPAKIRSKRTCGPRTSGSSLRRTRMFGNELRASAAPRLRPARPWRTDPNSGRVRSRAVGCDVKEQPFARGRLWAADRCAIDPDTRLSTTNNVCRLLHPHGRKFMIQNYNPGSLLTASRRPHRPAGSPAGAAAARPAPRSLPAPQERRKQPRACNPAEIRLRERAPSRADRATR